MAHDWQLSSTQTGRYYGTEVYKCLLPNASLVVSKTSPDGEAENPVWTITGFTVAFNAADGRGIQTRSVSHQFSDLDQVFESAQQFLS